MPGDAREFGKLAVLLGILGGLFVGANWQKIKKYLNPAKIFTKGK